MAAPADAFITEVDVPQRRDHSTLLDPVRKEHTKVREVVEAFSNKVEKLVDKQRNEYIYAYENHMQDVQRELHQLREKVADIANDQTKNEKTEMLKQDQKKYKSEALKLEIDTDEIRKKIRKAIRQIYSVEKTRDWMLKRLRQAKKKYTELLKERAQVYEEWDAMSMSLASMSNGSSYTLEMGLGTTTGRGSNGKAINTQRNSNGLKDLSNPHARMETLFAVDRDRILPDIVTGALNSPAKPKRREKQTGGDMNRGDSLPVLPNAMMSKSLPTGLARGIARSKSGPILTASFCNAVLMRQDSFDPDSRRNSRAAVNTTYTDADNKMTMELAEEMAAVDDMTEEQAVARLVSLRSRQQEVRKFLSVCASSLHKAPWSRVKKRPIVDLLAACEDKLHSNGRFRDEQLLQLVCELASMPETYSAILDIFEHYAPLPENFKHDHEIDAAKVVNPKHHSEAAKDCIADELLQKFSKQAMSSNVVHAALHQRSYDEQDELLSPPPIAPSPQSYTEHGENDAEEGQRMVDDFRAQLGEILQDAPSQQQPQQQEPQGGSLLDDDLQQYFKHEHEAKQLSNLGFFHEDEFLLDFKLSKREQQFKKKKK